MSADVIRVILADDHSVVRAGLRAVLGTAKDIEVVGEASSGREAVALVERGRELLDAGDFEPAARHFQRVTGFDDPAVTADVDTPQALARLRGPQASTTPPRIAT